MWIPADIGPNCPDSGCENDEAIRIPYWIGIENRPASRVDSGLHSVEKRTILKKGLLMPEENATPATLVAEGSATVHTPERAKRSTAKRQKAAGETKSATSKATASKPSAKSRKFSEQEKLEKLRQIGAQVADGASTMKDAIKSAGISEQTYYNWKGSLKADDQPSSKSASAGDEFAELVQLEAENQKLRKLLAEKLRAENAELRKKLGID